MCNTAEEGIISGIRRGRGKPERAKSQYRINKEVRAAEVRLIDEEGTVLGVMSAQQAYEAAQDRGLDLIEIAPTAKPPTCKIMDYGKWKYENKKKEKESRKNQTVIVIKEVQIRPRTDEHDLNVKLRKATQFLLDGSKVKINLRFSGREMAHQDIGFNLLQSVLKRLDHLAEVESPPKKEGRHLFALLIPDPQKVKAYQKEQAAASKEEQALASKEEQAPASKTEADKKDAASEDGNT